MQEEWRAVIGWKYEISSLGRLRRSDNKRLKSFDTFHGNYYAARLFTEGRSKKYLIHRLVAEAFIENPENKPQVNHKDGNKLNNTATNLEWVTAKENRQHAHDTGLCNYRTGDNCSWSKISESQRHEIVTMIESGERYRSIAAKYNISRSLVGLIGAQQRRNVGEVNNSLAAKRRKVATPIVDQFGTCYNSITEAANLTNNSIGNVHSVLTGKRKIAKGYKFFWKEERK